MALALYNKYRPYNLSMVCGQEHIKLILANQVINNKVSHAYLFSGPAGVGKTTVARIIGCMVNATGGQKVDISLDDPVVEKIINGKGNLDTVEVDAASQRGIDDIRALRDKVYLSPMELRKKIYIIDECHQLTNEAWNALLKILEEPPEHAIFIFCTTDSKKVLETIKTRCQCFEFRLISAADILTQCKAVAIAEKIEIEEEALKILATSAKGSLRDAISKLERLSAVGNITTKAISQVLGITSTKVACDFISAVIERNILEGMRASNEAMSIGMPAADFFSMIAEALHQILMSRLKGYSAERAGHIPEEVEKIKSLMEQFVKYAGPNTSKVIDLWIGTLDRFSRYNILRSQHLVNMAFVAMCLDAKDYRKETGIKE